MKDLKVLPKSAMRGQTAKAVRASVSRNTLRSYRSAVKALEAWLNGRALTDTLLADYISELFYEGGKSPSGIAQIISAVKWRMGDVDVVGQITKRALAGIRREGVGRGRGSVQGLSYEDVDGMVTTCLSEKGLKGLRDALLVRLMSDCLLRVSEAVAVNVEDFYQETLIVRRSKTDQEGEGASLFVCDETFDLRSQYLDASKITEGALFRRMFKDGTMGKRLTSRSAREIIKVRANEAGLFGFISGHSLRVGAAESLAEGGASLVEMQTAGRWADPKMPAHYARSQMARRGVVARMRNSSEKKE